MARVFFVAAVLLSCLAVSAHGFNITKILAPYPDFTLFNQWLSLTGVVNEVNNRTSITVLAANNVALQSYLNSVPNAVAEPQLAADALRYQILLTYFGIPELNKISVKNHTSVTTLLQTTGRQNASQGFVDIYNTGKNFVIGHFIPDAFGNETIVTNVTQSPYAYSVLQISSVIVPPLPASYAPALAPSPAPAAGKKPGSSATATSISTPFVFGAMLLASAIALL